MAPIRYVIGAGHMPIMILMTSTSNGIIGRFARGIGWLVCRSHLWIGEQEAVTMKTKYLFRKLPHE